MRHTVNLQIRYKLNNYLKMTPAFQVKEFLSLPKELKSKSVEIKKRQKISAATEFNTKFCCRHIYLKELISFHNVADRAISDSNSYTKIIGLSGEGGIGKSRLVLEFIRKISLSTAKNILKINYSDKNNLIFSKDIDSVKNIIESKIISINKSNTPAVIILEDVHWYEAEEKKKIEKLLFAFSGELPIPFRLSAVFVVTFRKTPSNYNFEKYDSYEEINLPPLTEEESGEFINNSELINKRRLRPDTIQKTISLSAGIPFYIEEFLKSLTLENGFSTIPDSVEQLLWYKLSFVNTDVLKVLEVIAAWDGNINKEVLKIICLKLRLIFIQERILLSTGFVKSEKKGGEVDYLFQHDIYKNYVYSQIEKHAGLLIHKTIAEIFEKGDAKNEHTLYKLYYHYKKSDEIEKAYSYLESYIKKTIEQREYEIALQRIDELKDYYSNNEKKMLEIWLLKIKCMRMLVQAGEMKQQMDKVKFKILKYKNDELYLSYLWLQAELFLLSNDFTKAFRTINIGLKLSRRQKNILLEAEFQFLLARNLNTTGKINECLKEAGKLLKISEDNNIRKYYYWANYLFAVNLQTLQNYKESNKIIEKFILISKNEDDLVYLNMFYKAKAKYCFVTKKYKKFVELTHEQYKLDLSIQDSHHTIVSLLNLSKGFVFLTEYKEATEILKKILRFLKNNNSNLFLKRVYESFANIFLEQDKYPESEKACMELLKLYDTNDYRNLSIIYSNLIIISYSLDKLEESEKYYKKSLFYATKMKRVSSTIICHYNIGLVFYLSGKINEGEKFIKKAYNLLNKHYDKEFNYNVNLTLAEIYLSQGKMLKVSKILLELTEKLSFKKLNSLEHFTLIFNKLLINSDNQKKYMGFKLHNEINNFITDFSISYELKLKIAYYVLLLSQKGWIRIGTNTLKKYFITILQFKPNTKNKMLLFYLNQITK